MIENSTLRVGGNTIKVWFGEWLEKMGKSINEWGTKTVTNNKPKIVTNPSGKLYNPFILVISFTVDTNQKYQIVLEGDYKEKYKECVDGAIELSENEMFMIINSNQPKWFKKD